MKKPRGFDKWKPKKRLYWYDKNFASLLPLIEDLKARIKDSEKNSKQKVIGTESLTYNDEINLLLSDIVNLIIDPYQNFYAENKEEIFNRIENLMEPKAVGINNSETKDNEKTFDKILESFVLGANGSLSTWDKEQNNSTNLPLLIRGIGGRSRRAIHHCWETGRPFYTVDTGYLGNNRNKLWHRVTYNNLQHLGPIVERPHDRLKLLGYSYRDFTPGSKILICPPSDKVMMLFDQPDAETWTAQVVEQIKELTDRPIEIRMKPSRTERTTTKTIWAALEDDVHCLVTYNSIAATEALLHGKPAIALGPNAAQVLCDTSLDKIENPTIPTQEEIIDYAAHLSYCQFNVKELQDGTAWRIVNESC